MNRPLLKIFQIVWRTTKWRVDWQRSLRLGRSIVASLGEDIEGHPLFAIENSQIDSLCTKDNFIRFEAEKLEKRIIFFTKCKKTSINQHFLQD